ncbi:hypothetical protein M409DRAFT_60341 [Zasmidium cellare ATCC 36951]|uniref:Uncharacterized protein n=1 Tax=Zasmidium cellare ATCC 36951 TaxID=1080233 RepID=A0A6A6BYQ1_ZASCE|nr:uncharacterized protein M409DRAFT_60341 [Zasmidium cellare ATCC 36951]KAF2159927.1 hypothetical protein M409DRAFT_60341 [Zasmidium cellare ATCC 36951]
MPGFTAVNQRHRSVEASSSRIRQVEPVEQDVEEASRVDRAFRGSHESQEDDLPAQIPDRDWEIISIIDRKDVNGLLLYQVRWAYTKHPTAILHTRRRGEAVNVDGQVCKVLRRSTTQPDLETGEHTMPLELVAEYELKDPRQANRLQPSFALHREPWKFEPEEEEDIEKRGDIEGNVFEPEVGIDYTMSFLEQEPRPYDLGRVGKHRAVYVYMVGDAWRKTCSHCESFDQSLPFAKCVTLDGALMGACANCAYLGRGKGRSLHHDVRPEHTIRCTEAHASGSPTSASSSASSPNDSAVDLSSDSTMSSSPVRMGWVSPSPTPPGSPELGSDDFQGNDVHDQEPGDERLDQQRSDKRAKAKSARRKRAGDGDRAASQGPSHKVKKRRSRKWKKFVKREQFSCSSIPSASLHLDTCRGAPYPCTHPIAGCEPQVIEDDSMYPPHVVFNDRVFRSGQAMDEEVRYILSRCWCETTEYIQELWDTHQA